MPLTLQFRRAVTRDVAITEFVMAPNFLVPSHDHEPPHVLVMLSGSLIEKCGAADVHCAPRSIRYSPGGDAHSGIHIGADGAHCLVIEAHAFPELRLINRVYLPEADVRSNIAAIEHCLMHAPSASPSRIEELSLQLFSLVRERARPTHSRHHQWVSRIGPFLDELTGSAAPLVDAAAHVARNASIVARLFRASHGVSVQRYVRRRQLDRAWQQLVSTDLPLSEVAAECGFTDQSHMTRAFARDAGVSPAQLRARVRSGGEHAAHWYRAIPLQNISPGHPPE